MIDDVDIGKYCVLRFCRELIDFFNYGIRDLPDTQLYLYKTGNLHGKVFILLFYVSLLTKLAGSLLPVKLL